MLKYKPRLLLVILSVSPSWVSLACLKEKVDSFWTDILRQGERLFIPPPRIFASWIHGGHLI
jgi:hypothetical protein